MSAVDQFMPDAAVLEQLRAAPEAPIVLLNLLAYRTPGGRDAFARYSAISGPLILEAGAKVIYGGRAGPVLTGSDVAWDDVLILRFPTPAKFLAMIAGDVYVQQAAPIRAEAFTAAIWLASFPFPGFEVG